MEEAAAPPRNRPNLRPPPAPTPLPVGPFAAEDEETEAHCPSAEWGRQTRRMYPAGGAGDEDDGAAAAVGADDPNMEGAAT